MGTQDEEVLRQSNQGKKTLKTHWFNILTSFEKQVITLQTNCITIFILKTLAQKLVQHLNNLFMRSVLV